MIDWLRKLLANPETFSPATLAPELEIVDIRKDANPWRVTNGKRWSVVVARRPRSQITGICLHATACVLGERPQRWATCGAHFGVMRSGRVVHIYDEDKYVVHGNGWNRGTIGVEIDGLFEGVEGDIRTVWDDPSTAIREQPNDLTDAQVTATKALIRWLVDIWELKALVAHRQSSETRRSDPGAVVWKRIALPMMEELGLSDGGPGFKIGGGYPIPREWDASRTAKY